MAEQEIKITVLNVNNIRSSWRHGLEPCSPQIPHSEGEPPPGWHKHEQPHHSGHSPLSLVQDDDKLKYSPSSAASLGLRRNEECAEPLTAQPCCPVQGFPWEGTGKALHRQQRWSCLGWASRDVLHSLWDGWGPCSATLQVLAPTGLQNPSNPGSRKAQGFSVPA